MTQDKTNEDLESKWKDILKKFPTGNSYNTIPEGETKITFKGEPNEFDSYKWRGKDKKKRYHVIVLAIIHPTDNTIHKITEIIHPLGLSRNAAHSLFKFLKKNASNLSLINRTFICNNPNNKKYSWREVFDDEKR